MIIQQLKNINYEQFHNDRQAKLDVKYFIPAHFLSDKFSVYVVEVW